MNKLTLLIFTTYTLNATAQSNIGINTSTPDASAILDITANNRGLLVPRIALTASNLAAPVITPALSLLVFNTATAGTAPNDVKPGYYYWNGTKWVGIGTGNAWELLGNTGTTAGTNFIGTTDAVDLVTKTNNTEKMRVTSAGNIGIGTPTPNTSALLDMVSTSKGLLIPRVTTVQRLAINNNTADATIAGLQVYDLTTSTFWYHDGTYWVQASNNPDPSLGAISIFPYLSIPADYLECNGAAVSRSTYAALFIKLGTTYGVGDGSTTFNLPDLRGEFVRGFDNARGVDAARVLGSNQTDLFKSHTHYQDPSTVVIPGATMMLINGSGDKGATVGGTTQATGGVETRPRNVAMVYAIKAIPTTVTYGSTTINNIVSTTISDSLKANAWLLKGNSGTVATTNFVGTTDAVDFVTKTNNTEKMRVTSAGNIGVGTPTPNTSALLDMVSTTSGFAMPRMTSVQRKAIPSPIAGLQVYDLTLKGVYVFDGTWDCLNIPAGTVQHFANATVPRGYLECNGNPVSRTTYAELFAAIGTVYGIGDGSTTFNLPDLRGEFIRGASNGRAGVDVGRIIGTAQTDDFKSHTHTLTLTDQDVLGGAYPTGSNVGSSYTNLTPIPINQTGGTETRPRNVAMMPCIKF